MNLIIKKGTVVTAEKTFQADILISGEKIKGISKTGFTENNAEIIDAAGKFVLPGVIDPHVHFGLEAYGSSTADDFKSGTMAAASGGVTTVIDYAIPGKAEVLSSAVRRRINEAKYSYVDYSFHAQITNWSERTQKDFENIVSSGITSFKIFMPKTEGWGISDWELLKIFEKAGRYPVIVELHAESSSLIDGFTNNLIAQKKTGVKNFYYTRPNVVEEEAVNRACFLAQRTGAKIYFVHTTTEGAVEISEKARKNGLKILIETCPQYLMLTKSVFEKKAGYLFATCPPVKLPSDNAALWNGLKTSLIKTIGTDHCAFSKSDKMKCAGDFRKLRFGMPGVETSFAILYSEGVVKKRITLNKLIEITSENAAKIFGLYPKKGAIKPGSDADIIIFDPLKKWTVRYEDLNTRCGWTPYEGMKITGKTVITILRGKIIFKNGEFLSENGYGKFQKRKGGMFLC